jgi:arsenate reductase
MTAHWGVADPATADGSLQEQQRAFHLAFNELDARIKIFVSLRIEMLDRLSLQRQLDEIGNLRREKVLE